MTRGKRPPPRPAGNVPLPPTPGVHRTRPEAFHDRQTHDRITGRLLLGYEAAQPIHVGSGFTILRGRTLISGAYRVSNRLAVPGSTWKGVFRSRFEAITRSCLRRECRGDMFCATCALFGCLGLRARVVFRDSLLPSGLESETTLLPSMRSTRRPAKGRMFLIGSEPAPPGSKTQRVECIPAKTELPLEIRLMNLSTAELGGILAASGCEPRSSIKLGGGKSYGLGRISLVRFSLEPHSPTEAPLDVTAWTNAFGQWSHSWPDGVRELCRIHGPGC